LESKLKDAVKEVQNAAYDLKQAEKRLFNAQSLSDDDAEKGKKV